MKPLNIRTENWRSRWLMTEDQDVLHRVGEIIWDDPEDMTEGKGVTVCERSAHMKMPGFFSRMGLQRCRECCKLLDVPEGDGNPYNEGIDECTS